jgi:hypothetical protein
MKKGPGNVYDKWNIWIRDHYPRGLRVPQFFLSYWRRTACTEFFSWFQCTQTVFKINIIIYRNISYLHQHALMNFITCNHYLRKYLIKGELRCSGRVGSSYSISGTRRVNLVTNLVINREYSNVTRFACGCTVLVFI